MGTEDMRKLRACMGTEDMLKLRACMGTEGMSKVTSTSIGWMSPGVGLFRAVRLPPAKKMAMSSGALLEISRLMTSW